MPRCRNRLALLRGARVLSRLVHARHQRSGPAGSVGPVRSEAKKPARAGRLAVHLSGAAQAHGEVCVPHDGRPRTLRAGGRNWREVVAGGTQSNRLPPPRRMTIKKGPTRAPFHFGQQLPGLASRRGRHGHQFTGLSFNSGAWAAAGSAALASISTVLLPSNTVSAAVCRYSTRPR